MFLLIFLFDIMFFCMGTYFGIWFVSYISAKVVYKTVQMMREMEPPA